MVNSIENVIEFRKDEERATVTFSQRRFKNMIRKMAEKYPKECVILAENNDNSLCACIPVSWVNIRRPGKRSYSEAQRAKMSERMLSMKQTGKLH